nr:hypothetical protein [Tanacetum cinerariifolium]
MSTLAEFMIVVDADNRPPMLDKLQYESWKTHVKLYIQGLPLDVYALVNHHKVAKDIWDRVKLLMQGKALSKQKRECKLYDEFDKFFYVKERFDTLAGNPIKEILLKLNLPDHRSILTDLKVTPTKPRRITKPYSSPHFIANCFISRIYKDGRGGLVKIFKIPWNNNLNHVQQQLFNTILLYHCSIKFLSFCNHFKMSTLAEFMIVVGADNRPPMLDKPQYESWKSHVKLYIQGKDHGWIILNSVENDPLVWPTVELKNGNVRPKTYEELFDKEKLQADCDLKATNIVLQGLPLDVYALFNQHKVAKDIWDRVKLLMQGKALSKQKRECKLYDEFDKFFYMKGETLH